MSTRVGLIAEDDSDIDVLKELLAKISGKKISVEKFVGNGCGKIIGKCRAWTENLALRGCKAIVVVHDQDEKNFGQLQTSLRATLSNFSARPYLIVIPIREIEAWLLADHDAINSAFDLKTRLGKIANPESIMRPKEHLRDLVWQRSKKTKKYFNTIHNKKIAEKCTTKSLARCSSFIPLQNFIVENFSKKKRRR